MSLSQLERLTTELIQFIFTETGLNPALPAASPHIAAKLSHPRIYETVCDQWLTPCLPHDAQTTWNQTILFAAYWMTWDFFKSFILRNFEEVGCLCGKTAEEGCSDAQWPPDFNDATTMKFSRAHWPTLSYVKCRIPAKLLRGPWTRDKIQFLRFLLWTTSMTVDWADPYILEVARLGRKQAFLERNLEAVQLINHNRRLGRSPNLEHVRFAVLEAGCDRSVVYDTMMNARWGGVKGSNWKCEQLDAWCDVQIRNGDPKGQWLKLKLQELRYAGLVTSKIFKEHGEESVKERIIFGSMYSTTGDYEDMPEDQLVIPELNWRKAARDIGWFRWVFRLDYDNWKGVHGVSLIKDVLDTRPGMGLIDTRSCSCVGDHLIRSRIIPLGRFDRIARRRSHGSLYNLTPWSIEESGEGFEERWCG